MRVRRAVREVVLYHFGQYGGQRLFENVKVQNCQPNSSKLLKYKIARRFRPNG